MVKLCMLCVVFVELCELVIVEKCVNIGVLMFILVSILVWVYFFRFLLSWKYLCVLVLWVCIMCLGMCLWLKWVIFLWKRKFFIRVGLCLFVCSEFWLLLMMCFMLLVRVVLGLVVLVLRFWVLFRLLICFWVLLRDSGVERVCLGVMSYFFLRRVK